MSTNTNQSGIIKRIFVETHDVITYAKFTLIGDKTIYAFSTREHDIRKKLELTSPGDTIEFEHGITGWLLKDKVLLKFTNITLDSEIG
jgi:uncharacterized membrane protein affecting hemolysin expression